QSRFVLQAEDGIRDRNVTGVQTCALPILALALGIGTMMCWRSVAMTIGEKIGKRGMTYAQGMAAQMTAAVSIGLASYIGMPVSKIGRASCREGVGIGVVA